LTGGQEVEGSNPFAPTKKIAKSPVTIEVTGFFFLSATGCHEKGIESGSWHVANT